MSNAHGAASVLHRQALLINFNHERFVIAVQANRCARLCLQEVRARAATTLAVNRVSLGC